MECVTSGRVVDNDGVSEWPPYERHVFDEDTLEESTVFSEQSVVYDLLGSAVQDINQRIGVLAQACCVNY